MAYPQQRPIAPPPLNRVGVTPSCCQSTWQILYNSDKRLEYSYYACKKRWTLGWDGRCIL